jgi:N-acyl-D-amino-acid deacylase
VHPFRSRPSWQAIQNLPWPQQYARLSDPAFKARLLGEANLPPEHPDLAPLAMIVTGGWGMQFPLGDVPNYEPAPEESIAALAAARGRDPAELAYDLLMADEGNGFIYLPLLNYADGNLDFLHDMLLNRDDVVISLSDGGAHCGTICDAASPTFLLQHWVRDRTRGRIPLELAVRRQCRDTALLYGLNDRGLLQPGYLADLNVIDLEALALEKPYLSWDLPAGGRRLLQKARGYVATVKSGQITFRDGVVQAARPGKVIRGPQVERLAIAAE